MKTYLALLTMLMGLVACSRPPSAVVTVQVKGIQGADELAVAQKYLPKNDPSIMASAIRNTKLVEIVVTGADSTTAANRANELAETMRSKALEDQQREAEASLSLFTSEVEKQRAKVEGLRQIKDKILAESSGGDRDPEDIAVNADTKTLAAAKAYSVAKGNYIQAKRLLEAADARLASEKLNNAHAESPIIIWSKAEVLH